MYHEYTQEDLRQYCRKNIESLEIWARRLIHEKMVEKYGHNYVSQQLDDGNYLVKSEIRKHIQGKIAKEPMRFHRAVDTLFIDQIIYFLCHPIWYKELFKQALDYIYPQGRDEAREFLNRLVPIRNPLSHSNPITMHDVERAICYSHDFIEGLKKYYKDRGEDQVWNVPRIIKVKDSLGNVFENPVDIRYGGTNISIEQSQNCGDKYSIEVEIDSSFTESEYNIYWKIPHRNGAEFVNKRRICIAFEHEDVSMGFMINCMIISNKSWHKYGNHDGEVTISMSVLPPTM